MKGSEDYTYEWVGDGWLLYSRLFASRWFKGYILHGRKTRGEKEEAM